MASDANKKAFIRILKEIGLYNEWIRERKKFLGIHSDIIQNFEMDECIKDSFKDSLIFSFYFGESSYPEMWKTLYDSFAPSTTNYSLINNENLMDVLKSYIESYMKWLKK